MKSFIDIAKERRSVHFFDTNKELEDKTLRDIIDLASYTPSAYNLQPWSVIAVKSKEAKEKLYNLAFKQPKILEAPVTLIITGDRNGFSPDNKMWDVIANKLGEDFAKQGQQGCEFLHGANDERRISFAVRNASLYSMSLMYAAKAYGVESHPISGLVFEEVKKAFNVPESHDVVMALSLGYFDDSKELYEQAKRLKYDDVVTEV